jgi:hypothetical protein
MSHASDNKKPSGAAGSGGSVTVDGRCRVKRDRSHESGVRYRSAGSRSTVGRIFRTRVASHRSCLLANPMLAKAAGNTPCIWGCQAEERVKIATAGDTNCPTGKSRMGVMRKLPVVPICRNPSALPLPPNQRQIPCRPVLNKGRFAIVTDVEAGCGGREGAVDEQRQRGQRSRVVLTPRRWRQGRGAIRERRWQKSPVTGESAKQPLKPLRREGRIDPANLW